LKSSGTTTEGTSNKAELPRFSQASPRSRETLPYLCASSAQARSVDEDLSSGASWANVMHHGFEPSQVRAYAVAGSQHQRSVPGSEVAPRGLQRSFALRPAGRAEQAAGAVMSLRYPSRRRGLIDLVQVVLSIVTRPSATTSQRIHLRRAEHRHRRTYPAGAQRDRLLADRFGPGRADHDGPRTLVTEHTSGRARLVPQ